MRLKNYPGKLKAIGLLLFLPLLLSCAEQKQNFVVILIDDLGWTDPGYAGSRFHETPNIDALSHESITFTDAYSSASVCSPSRAAILTGKHPVSLNITDWIPGNDPANRKLLGPEDLNELPLEEITLAELLKQHGYTTFFAGKWHLGGEEFYPEDQGFMINLGGHHAGSPPGGYYSPYKNPKLADGPEGEYLTDRLTNEAVKFLDSIGQDPFLLFLSYYTVHTPIQANRKYIKKFEDKLETMDLPATTSREEGEGITNLEQQNPAYASMLYALDLNIGKLINKLKDEGLFDHTTIIFTSDNGGLSTLQKKRKNKAPTAVHPLRAGKGWLYEGGIRVPLLIKPADFDDHGKTCTEAVVGHDLFSTILAQADVVIEDKLTDGIDLSPLFSGNNTLNREELFWHYPHYHGSGWKPGSAMRQGEWKLVEFHETGKTELYNLAIDISERKDLSGDYPEISKKLKKRLNEWLLSRHAKPAILNKDYNSDEHSPG